MSKLAGNSVVTVVHHRVKLNQIDEYIGWQKKLTKASEKFEGYVNTILIEPGMVTPNDNEYVIIFKFENAELLQRWNTSEIREKILSESSGFSEESPKLRTFMGLEHWFMKPGETPSRGKMTVVSFFAIGPLVYFIPPNLGGLLIFNDVINQTIITAVVTICMSYIALPIMTRIFKRWLSKT
ncbi:hypothetical protein QSV34_01755 [Porticoccus sp. W117]|uniref:hypothetical protein n=1 Tax=Porticoccus sp. W117 TaxID=3054777 RepID=UPI0025924463|nr:hypothetical protein [Porticoccus sp. W117]MDM3870072.1 hypothetical protein [Porticoccus sp. W117]